jgi:hypothetical protein
VAAVQRRTKKRLTEIVKESLALYCEVVLARPQGTFEALERSGFIGCAVGPVDLSEHYKTDLWPSPGRPCSPASDRVVRRAVVAIRIALAALVASAALNGGLLWARYREPAVAVDDEAWPGTGAAPEGARPSSVQRTLVANAANDPACLARRDALRAEVERAAQELRRVAPADRLFRMGAPNEGARARLAPVIARALAGDGGAPSHTLECRDQVCRLSILQREGEDANRWMWPLQDPRQELQSRYSRHGVGFTGVRWVKDPVTGEDLKRHDCFVKLANADGSPLGEDDPRAR